MNTPTAPTAAAAPKPQAETPKLIHVLITKVDDGGMNSPLQEVVSAVSFDKEKLTKRGEESRQQPMAAGYEIVTVELI